MHLLYEKLGTVGGLAKTTTEEVYWDQNMTKQLLPVIVLGYLGAQNHFHMIRLLLVCHVCGEGLTTATSCLIMQVLGTADIAMQARPCTMLSTKEAGDVY